MKQQESPSQTSYQDRLVALTLLNPDWAEFSAFELAKEPISSTWNTVNYPSLDKVFRAFNECPLEDLKVVILGMDPYHDGSSLGLAFDNNREQRKLSPSLRNILSEMDEDIGPIVGWSKKGARISPSHLGHLPQQGVLLINTALTVEQGSPGSHTELWKPFTEQLIKELQAKDNLVWMLWGNHAKSFKPLITNTTHYILEGGHPSPLNRKRDFKGGKYFSKANEFLKLTNQTEIKW